MLNAMVRAHARNHITQHEKAKKVYLGDHAARDLAVLVVGVVVVADRRVFCRNELARPAVDPGVVCLDRVVDGLRFERSKDKQQKGRVSEVKSGAPLMVLARRHESSTRRSHNTKIEIETCSIIHAGVAEEHLR